jgi:hypothetical protein
MLAMYPSNVVVFADRAEFPLGEKTGQRYRIQSLLNRAGVVVRSRE